MQTATQTSVGFKAGVKDYRLTYFMEDYKVHVNDLLAAFRVVPQPGVPPEEAGAAIAAESSTGTWTTVWTDGLTSLDRYKGRCYDIELVSGAIHWLRRLSPGPLRRRFRDQHLDLHRRECLWIQGSARTAAGGPTSARCSVEDLRRRAPMAFKWSETSLTSMAERW